ncbi:ssDNA binding protein [Curtobacterium phage Reje]|uniref:ssDNA binding protein n=1 Tax=Curtobacterium phage Reje TaxID=2851069 RepID=UPI0021FD9050|nr:ssDNA binding protein [Curtobacterium phage Reje]QXG07809.1 ssDNA binding protein [Curtobacterium phage Reje]
MSNTEIATTVQHDEPTLAPIERDILRLTGGKSASIASTMETPDQDSRIRLAAAVANSEAIADELGKTIAVTHVIFQAVTMTNEQTGELQTVPRVVLMDAEGSGHHAISAPLYRDVTNLLGIIGDPNTWDKPVNVKVLKEGKGTGQYFTVKYVL